MNYGESDLIINKEFHYTASTKAYYWSSTSAVDSEHAAWGVHFKYGNVYSLLKNYNFYVRCVRTID